MSQIALDFVIRLKDMTGGALVKVQEQLQRELNSTKREADEAATAVGHVGKEMQAVDRAPGPRGFANALDRVRQIAQQTRTALGSMLDMGRRLGEITAPVAAAAYVVSRPMGQTMDYGMRLAAMSNTAFSDRDTAGRVAGKAELDQAIVAAVRAGGGTRDAAAQALDTLLASGAMSGGDAMKLLPTLVRAGTASGADPNELAQIALRGTQTFGIDPSQAGRVLDMAITAGQAGGFELRDMARWLPQQMAAARAAGMSGVGGMAKLLAANQAAVITAGSKDEAGNNLVNLLAKINSQDTAKDAGKLGIDLSGALVQGRAQGKDALESFLGVVDSVVAKDADFQRLQQQLKTAKGDDRRAMLTSQADILQGSAVGQIIQDRQALMALVALMGNRDYVGDVQRKALAGGGATDRNYAVIAQEAGFQVAAAKQEKDIASNSAMSTFAPAVAKVAKIFSQLAQDFPVLSAAIAGAVTVLAAITAAGTASGVLGGLLGKGAAGGAAAAVAGGAKGLLGMLARAAPVVAAGAGGDAIGSVLNDWMESKGINPGVWLAEAVHGDGSTPKQRVKVDVEVHNGEIVASVNKQNAQAGRRR